MKIYILIQLIWKELDRFRILMVIIMLKYTKI
nr:MAG TPA_asm: hypothetical protein [Caudoviricetes sp.]